MNNKVLMIIGVLVLVGVGAFVLMQSQNNTVTQPGTSTDESMTAEDQTSEIEQDAAMEDEVAENIDSESEDMGTVKTFEVSGSNFAFDMKTMTVKKGDTVRVVFTNAEGMHDWVIDEFDARTQILQAGGTETIEFVADTTGEFEYYCSVGQHRQNGMVGTLIVE